MELPFEGHIPLTRMLAPGAMGESHQIANNDTTAEGEAQNRRVVVRVLQNKAIAGVWKLGRCDPFGSTRLVHLEEEFLDKSHARLFVLTVSTNLC